MRSKQIRLTPEFGYYMPYGRYGVMENHPWTGIAHHPLNPLFHIRAITMYRAFAATALILAERTISQTLAGILQQSRAISA